MNDMGRIGARCDLKLLRIEGGRAVEVAGRTVALEGHLQRIIERNMGVILGIRFLASEYSTGPWHRGRIDTLGLDENGTPVIVEYKRTSDQGVITQAVSYLSWLRASRHEFQALVKRELGDAAADSIDRRHPRVVCIAADFTRHDRFAVHPWVTASTACATASSLLAC
ncbi:endonuclease NucS domain-containing protein [Streptomyces silvisoli]|uniref:Endonuclease NucS n=1 Tax=Streptomyces silvisoli TaxID=3034235 RepID=A0ABT5ZUW1_9ACTN|nr:endonuclease NucS domain-containing protein [Streptomyces silvisoli]MDF3293615.1 endonuclease NucS [Streptomyces silvisoli]